MQNYTKYQNASLLITRISIAAIFLAAGYGKIPFWQGETMGMPAVMVYIMQLLAIVEPLGAVAILFGFLTRWAAAGLSIIMVGAILITQFVMKVGFMAPAGPGWSYCLMILAGSLMLMAFGPGKYSIEATRNR